MASLLRLSSVLCALADLHALLSAAAAASKPASSQKPRTPRPEAQQGSSAPGSSSGSSRAADRKPLRAQGQPPGSSRSQAEQQEQGSNGAPRSQAKVSREERQRSKQYARTLGLAVHKAWFMLVWAAEQPDELFAVLRSQTEAEAAAQAPAQQTQGSVPAVLAPEPRQRDKPARVQEL